MPKGQHGNHSCGPRHHRWNGGKIISSTGHVKVRVGCNHPLADPNGYAYEHIMVWCAAGYSRPDKGEVLHHKNGDKADNRLENLELMTRARHNQLHNRGRQRDGAGRFTKKAGNLLDGKKWEQYPEGGQS